MPPIIGVLAVQGAFGAHVQAFTELGTEAREVRSPEQLDHVDALAMPGGESTTMAMMIERSGLREPLAERLADHMPVFATCAGLILLAGRVIDGRDDQWSFGALDIDVRRNAYGRQNDSFEAPIVLGVDDDVPFPGVFIRAPTIERTGTNVSVLATFDGQAVLVQDRSVLGSTFHPELTSDLRLHQQFLRMVGVSEGMSTNRRAGGDY